MNFLDRYIRFTDKLNQKTGSAASWLTLLLVAVISYDVFSRYLLQSGSVALQELEWHLFAAVFLLGAAYTLRVDEHVRVDVFYSKYSEKQKAWLNLAGVVLFLIPFCLMIIVTSFNFVKISFLLKETSPDAGGLPGRYILKALIPLSFILLILQGISLAFKSILVLKSKKE